MSKKYNYITIKNNRIIAYQGMNNNLINYVNLYKPQAAFVTNKHSFLLREAMYNTPKLV